MTASVLGVGQAPLDCAPHPLQHIFDCALGARERLHMTGTQHHIRVGPARRIEERIAADRHLGLALAISPSCMPMSRWRAVARVRTHPFREHANAGRKPG
jgi:hypothetical protein